MIQIKFNNDTKLYDCTTFRRININVVMLDFESDNTSGFATYKDGEQLGDFSDYKTIYRKVGGHTYYSNDGSKWVEPTKDVMFFVYWEDAKTTLDEVQVTIKSSENEQTITITKTNDWTYKLTCLEHEDYKIVSTQEIENYTYVINDNSVVYTSTIVTPTWQEKTEAQLLYTAVCTDTLLESETE